MVAWARAGVGPTRAISCALAVGFVAFLAVELAGCRAVPVLDLALGISCMGRLVTRGARSLARFGGSILAGGILGTSALLWAWAGTAAGRLCGSSGGATPPSSAPAREGTASCRGGGLGGMGAEFGSGFARSRAVRLGATYGRRGRGALGSSSAWWWVGSLGAIAGGCACLGRGAAFVGAAGLGALGVGAACLGATRVGRSTAGGWARRRVRLLVCGPE